MTCTVLIDESGDNGVSKLRSDGKPGSSNYFSMAAAVVQPATLVAVRQLISKLEKEFNKPKGWNHATDLNHSQKTYFCRELSKLHIRFFGIISYKPTLEDYAAEIEWDPHKFYNKCAKYLLERVGNYLAHFDGTLTEPDIIFERRNHDYDRLIRYISKVKENPIYSQSKSLNVINPFGIVSVKKSEELALKAADMASHAIYSCVNKTPDNFGIVETRYLRELAPRFAADESGVVSGTGLKFIHKAEDLHLDAAVLKELKGMRALPRPKLTK